MEKPQNRTIEVTQLLSRLGQGDTAARHSLLDVVYEELRAQARVQMAREPANHTLQPTALVHEAYLRLLGGGDAAFENRQHFFGAAAQAMRRILIERARRVAGPQRGGGLKRQPLDQVDAAIDPNTASLLSLDEALSALEKKDPRAAEVVALRYFGGLSVEETAEAMGLSPRTVKREWMVARAWLYRFMEGGGGGEGR